MYLSRKINRIIPIGRITLQYLYFKMLKNKEFWKNFVNALATLASLATLITFLFNWRAKCIDTWILISLSILIVVICFGYGWLMILRKKKISIDIHPSFKVTIEFGDLFDRDHEGIFVIPVNEYFDTELKDSLVTSSSVMGTFINKYWNDRVSELDDKICKALDGKPYEENAVRQLGKKNKYKLGTCADVKDGGNDYVLIVTTKKNDDGKSILYKKDYPIVIEGLFKHLASIRQNRKIYMPLFGAGRGKMKRSLQRILSFLLDTIDFKHSELSLPDGMSIIIKKKYEDTINLNSIESHFINALKD